MEHVMQTTKRLFSAAVAAATIAMSVGAGVLVGATPVSAASAGDLIKGTSLSTVYYYGYDGERYVFPNETTFFTWYSDFDDVTTISDSALSDITLGGNVVMRPGSWWVKIQSADEVYAVARDGSIHWIESEDVASAFAGSDWNERIVDVPDVFFADYTVGTSLMEATAYEGMLYESGSATYLVWDGEMREVTEDGMDDNRLMEKFVMDGSGIDDSDLTAGDDVDGELLSLIDAAQTEEDEDGVTGDIEITASSSMPNGVTLVGGANSVEVFSFDVEAGSEDATLDSLVLSMIGAGATSNISAVYLYEGDTRLTESRTVNSSTREVTMNSLDVAIPAGDTVTLTVRVTISASQTAADTFGFELESADMVTASGDVDGDFPVEGDIFTLSGSDGGEVTVTKTGTIDDPSIGEDDAEIGNFKIEATGTEGVDVELITLKVDNASDHTDFNLWDGSTWLVACENTTGDQVVCDLSDESFEIEEGDSNIFALSADIGGQDADTIKVYVDNAIDVVAIGADYGYGVTVDITTDGTYDGTSCTSASGDCSFSTIQGGEVTFAFNGPSSGDIQLDAQDQVLLEFSLTAAQEVTIKDLDIIVYGDDDDNDALDAVDDSAGAAASDNDGLINSTEGNISDIKIIDMDTGSTVMGPLDLDSIVTAGDDADQTIDFTDDFTVEAGETLNLAVTVDVDNGVTSGTEFAAALDVSGLSIEDENGDALSGSDIVPGSDLTGNNQTAESASLAVSLASTPGDVTTVQGSDDVEVVTFTMTAGDSSDVTVTDVTVSVYGDDDGSGTSTIGGGSGFDVNDFVESCSLYEGDDLVGGPESPATNGQTISFDSMEWTLDASEVTNLSIVCNIANTSDTDSDYFSFDLADVSADITAVDEDGDTVTATGDAANGGTTIASANLVTVAVSGSLAVAIGSDMPSADFVLTGSSSNHVASYRFTATNEDFIVDTLTFSEEQAEDDLASTNSSGYANNISLVTIAFEDENGDADTATATMSNNEARFSDLGMLVTVDDTATVDVYVSVPATARVSGGSATSNEKIRMGLFVDTTNDDNFRAVGVGSDVAFDDDDQGAIGDDLFSTDGVPTFVVRETKPTITLSSSSPSGSAVVGRIEALRFNIAAASNEDVVLENLTFKISTTDIAGDGTSDWNQCDTDDDAGDMDLSDFDLYNLTVDGTATTLDNSSSDTHNTTVAHMSASTNNPWTLLKATGAMCDSTDTDVAFVRLDLPTAEVVPAGSTYTFALYFDATGASASNDDSVRFDISTDPITSTYLTVSNASNEVTTGLAVTDTTLEVDASSSFAVGDVISYDAADDGNGAADERMLITALTDSDTITVVRGYLGTSLTAAADSTNADDIFRLPGSFLWQDDGTASESSYDDFWGSYLVDNLTLNGGTLVF